MHSNKSFFSLFSTLSLSQKKKKKKRYLNQKRGRLQPWRGERKKENKTKKNKRERLALLCSPVLWCVDAQALCGESCLTPPLPSLLPDNGVVEGKRRRGGQRKSKGKGQDVRAVEDTSFPLPPSQKKKSPV
jgi:hypothetical protein